METLGRGPGFRVRLWGFSGSGALGPRALGIQGLGFTGFGVWGLQ